MGACLLKQLVPAFEAELLFDHVSEDVEHYPFHFIPSSLWLDRFAFRPPHPTYDRTIPPDDSGG